MILQEFGVVATYIWIGVVIGFAMGQWVEKRALRNILRLKAIDGTAEYIDGEFYYILNDEDYCQKVLGLGRKEKPCST